MHVDVCGDVTSNRQGAETVEIPIEQIKKENAICRLGPSGQERWLLLPRT